MADYRHVKQCAGAFNQAVEVLEKICEELEAAKYDESSMPWFIVSRGDKPWYFDVDWLGKTYRLQTAVGLEQGGESLRIKDVTLSVGVVEGPRQILSITSIAAAKIQLNARGSYVHYKSVASGLETIYPRDSAVELFFAMIGHPLDGL